MQKSIKKELKMPIKRGEIYLFVGFEAEKFSPKRLASSGLWFYFITASLPVPAF